MKTGEYLVGKPTTYCCSPTGRATKGYVAFDLQRRCLVFLKDVWRANSPRIRSELKTYIALNTAGVQYVPTILGGGDVGGLQPQHTLTQEYLNSPSIPLERLHSRLILLEIGRPLKSYENSTGLIFYTYDALVGMIPLPIMISHDGSVNASFVAH